MVLQGCNASERSETKIVNFYERLEFTESLSGETKGKNFQTDSKSGRKPRRTGDGKPSDKANNNKKRNTQKYCPLHDTHGHDISECKVLLNQAKKMRDSWQLKTPGDRRQMTKQQQEVNTVMKEFAATIVKHGFVKKN